MPFNSNIYNVDWNKLVRLMVPVLARKQRLLAFLYAFVSPVSFLNNSFMFFKKSIEYRLLITPQVCFLEKALNDKYDTALRRIFIIDAVEYNALPLYIKPENKRIVLYKKGEGHQVLYTRGETSIFTVDFIVKVPNAVNFNTVEMRAFIDINKMLSKTYQIQTF